MPLEAPKPSEPVPEPEPEAEDAPKVDRRVELFTARLCVKGFLGAVFARFDDSIFEVPNPYLKLPKCRLSNLQTWEQPVIRNHEDLNMGN